jgi:hypothetical protein
VYTHTYIYEKLPPLVYLEKHVATHDAGTGTPNQETPSREQPGEECHITNTNPTAG